MSFRVMYALIAAASAAVAYNVGKYLLGPGNWKGT